jgi:hypothetical protein
MEKDDRLIFLLGQARHRLMTAVDKSLLETAGLTTAQSGDRDKCKDTCDTCNENFGPNTEKHCTTGL